MHLDRGFALVPSRLVREVVERKIASEFAIDAGEKVEIELRGHASLVVVGGDQGVDVLAQVDADDRLAARADMRAHPAKQSGGVGWAKIAERRAGKKCRARSGGNVGGNVEVDSEIGDDRPDGQVRKPIAKALDRLGEKIRRDIDRRVQPRRAEARR